MRLVNNANKIIYLMKDSVINRSNILKIVCQLRKMTVKYVIIVLFAIQVMLWTHLTIHATNVWWKIVHIVRFSHWRLALVSRDTMYLKIVAINVETIASVAHHLEIALIVKLVMVYRRINHVRTAGLRIAFNVQVMHHQVQPVQSAITPALISCSIINAWQKTAHQMQLAQFHMDQTVSCAPMGVINAHLLISKCYVSSAHWVIWKLTIPNWNAPHVMSIVKPAKINGGNVRRAIQVMR